MTYKTDTDSFADALDAIVTEFARQNPSVGRFAYKTAGTVGKVGIKYNISITVSEPKAKAVPR